MENDPIEKLIYDHTRESIKLLMLIPEDKMEEALAIIKGEDE